MTGGAQAGAALRVQEPGARTLVQDLGRPGLERWGVAPSGAFDRGAHRLAQRLVGNAGDAAGLEVLLGGLLLVANSDAVLAVAGAPCPVTVDGRPESGGVALRVPAGATVALGRVEVGVRVYVAVRGGLAVPAVLGSRSRDTGAELGPSPVRAGDELLAGEAGTGEPWYGPPPVPVPDLADPAVVDVVPGPHDDVPGQAGWAAAGAARWVVGGDSDRVGVRLAAAGGVLAGLGSGTLASFPVVPGSVQLTPSGELVVLGPDAGVTGGYPVIGVVPPAGLDRLAQCRPGDVVRIRRREARRGRRRETGPDTQEPRPRGRGSSPER